MPALAHLSPYQQLHPEGGAENRKTTASLPRMYVLVCCGLVPRFCSSLTAEDIPDPTRTSIVLEHMMLLHFPFSSNFSLLPREDRQRGKPNRHLAHRQLFRDHRSR